MAKANIACGTCFYSLHSITEEPCRQCKVFSHWIDKDMYKETIYDIVSKPKHYMLFEQQGIEVRHVIEKLVEKLNGMPSMAIADYVQLMQYLMRFMDKGGVEDLKKGRWYLDKIIEQLEK